MTAEKRESNISIRIAGLPEGWDSMGLIWACLECPGVTEVRSYEFQAGEVKMELTAPSPEEARAQLEGRLRRELAKASKAQLSIRVEGPTAGIGAIPFSPARSPTRAKERLISLAGPIGRLLLSFTAMLVAITGVLWPLLGSSEDPRGFDFHLHMFKVWHFTDQLVRFHTIPHWMHHWYNGYPFWQYYGPLSYLVMVPLNLVLGDVFATYKVFVAACLLVGSLSTYLVARRWLGLGAAGATAAGLLYVLSPFNLLSTLAHAGVPRTLNIALMPLCLYFLLDILERPTRRGVLLFALTTAALILNHHSQGAMGFIWLAAFAATYILLRNVRLFHTGALAGGWLLGIAMTLWWLGPALTKADLPRVPWIRSDFIGGASRTWQVFNPWAGTPPARDDYFSLALLGFGVLGALARRDALSIALLTSAGVALLYAFGIHTPLYTHLPLWRNVIPERFLYYACLSFALLAASLPASLPLRRWTARLRPILMALLLLALFLDYRPYFRLAHTASMKSWRPFTETMASSSNDGRFDHSRAVEESSDTYYPPVVGQKYIVRGGSAESSPHSDRYYASWAYQTRGFSGYLFHNWALWNVRFMLADNHHEELIAWLGQTGFRAELKTDLVTLYAHDLPSSYVMVQDRSMLAIGQGAEAAAAVFPWLAQGHSLYVEDYPPEVLAPYRAVLFAGARSRSPGMADTVVRRLVREGKLVFVEEPPVDEPSLLGIGLEDIEVPRDVSLSLTAEGRRLLGSANLNLKPFPVGDASWRVTTHREQDGALVVATIAGKESPLIGYRELPEGRVYFLGWRLLSHILATQDEQATELMESLFALAHPNRNLYPEPFPIQGLEWGADSLSFSYTSDQPKPVIVSMTWSPHWKVRLDDQPWPLYNHEDLCLLSLPAGEHRVTFNYGTTPIQVGSALASLASTVILGLALILGWPWGERLLGGRRTSDVFRALRQLVRKALSSG